MNAPFLFANDRQVPAARGKSAPQAIGPHGPVGHAGHGIRTEGRTGVVPRQGTDSSLREKMGYVCATVKFAEADNIRIIGIVAATLYVSRPKPEAQARARGEW